MQATKSNTNTVIISRELLEAYDEAVDELADQFYSQMDFELDDPVRQLINRVDNLRQSTPASD